MTHILKLDHIEHGFGGKSILSKVNFTCNTGDIIAIFGRNGSGKSTLLKSLIKFSAFNKVFRLRQSRAFKFRTSLAVNP
ncbi:MAG: transporter-related protein [Bacteroidetes bacterium]|nr:transporter-related protein [Bacteroidota bacterium]